MSRRNFFVNLCVPQASGYAVPMKKQASRDVLAKALAENERIQEKFRNVVLIKLARIEAIVEMILGAEIVAEHSATPESQKKMREHARDTDKYIRQKSHDRGLKMISFIHDRSVDAGVRRKGRPKRTS